MFSQSFPLFPLTGVELPGEQWSKPLAGALSSILKGKAFHSTACPMALWSVPGFIHSSESRKQRSCPPCMCNALTYLFESYKNVPRKSLELPFPVLRNCSAAAPTSGMESWLFFVGFYFIDWFLFDFKGNSFFGIENSSHSVNYNLWPGVAASYFSCLEPKRCGVCACCKGPRRGLCYPRAILGCLLWLLAGLALCCKEKQCSDKQAAAWECAMATEHAFQFHVWTHLQTCFALNASDNYCLIFLFFSVLRSKCCQGAQCDKRHHPWEPHPLLPAAGLRPGNAAALHCPAHHRCLHHPQAQAERWVLEITTSGVLLHGRRGDSAITVQHSACWKHHSREDWVAAMRCCYQWYVGGVGWIGYKCSFYFLSLFRLWIQCEEIWRVSIMIESAVCE